MNWPPQLKAVSAVLGILVALAAIAGIFITRNEAIAVHERIEQKADKANRGIESLGERMTTYQLEILDRLPKKE